MPTESSNFAKVFADESAEIAVQCTLRSVADDLRLTMLATTLMSLTLVLQLLTLECPA